MPISIPRRDPAQPHPPSLVNLLVARKVVITPACCVRGGEGAEVRVGEERGVEVCVICGAGSGACGRREGEDVGSAEEVPRGEGDIPGAFGVAKVGPGFQRESGAFFDEEDYIEGGGEFECVFYRERGLRGGVEGDGDVGVEDF